jgi:nucleoid-associated protein YgaU
MKRFHWPLQRLLDVTARREQAQRAKLLALAQQVAGVRGELLRRQAVLTALLDDLGRQRLEQRMATQEVLMKYSARSQAEIDRLAERLSDLQARRTQETRRLRQLRASRETLERLRAEALDLHRKEQLRIEQRQLDENAQVRYVRERIERSRLGRAGARA